MTDPTNETREYSASGEPPRTRDTGPGGENLPSTGDREKSPEASSGNSSWEETTRDRKKLEDLANQLRFAEQDRDTKGRLKAAPPPPEGDWEPAEGAESLPPVVDPMQSRDVVTLDSGPGDAMESAVPPVAPPPPPARPGTSETVQYPADFSPVVQPALPESLDAHEEVPRTVGGPEGDDSSDAGEADRTADVAGPLPVGPLSQTRNFAPDQAGRIPTKDLGTFNVSGSGGKRSGVVETRTQQGTLARKGRAPGPGDHLQYFGDYELLSELARGGMGVVYRARQLTLGRMVALKMILAGSLATDYAVKRFLIEAEAAARLDHPNIVPIYEIGEHEGLHYFSMKFVEGTSLAALTKKLLADPRRTARILALVARAVAHAHQRGILHRDLKPSNILIDGDGEPHVTDFGLAKIVAEGREGDGLTMEGSVMGTPSYMAPEQAEGKSATLTTSADVWGLGAILYDCLTSVPPFKGDTALATVAMVRTLEPRPPSAINPDVPADLATICLKCLQKEPSKRYASADALALDLENWLEGKPISARPIGRIERTVMWARRRPALAGLAGAVVLSVVLGLAGILWQWSEAVTARRAETAARKVAENRAVQLQEQALRIRLQLNRAELLRGRMLLQSGDADRAESVLWAAALGSPWAAERFQSTTMPLTAGPLTPAEWALWDLYRQRPREGAIPGVRAMALGTSEDGQRIAGVSGNQITVYDRKLQETVFTATTTSTLLSQPTLSADGSIVAAADYLSGQVFVWELTPSNSGNPRWILEPPGQEGSGDAGEMAVQKTNPRLAFVGRNRMVVWNRSGMELHDLAKGQRLAKGPGIPDLATPDSEAAMQLIVPPASAPEDHVVLAGYGTELRPIRQLKGASAGLLEWGSSLPLGDDTRLRGRRAVLAAQAGRDGAIAVQTPAGALVSAATDGTSIVVVHRLSRDEVPRLDHLSLSPDSKTLVGLDERTLYVWSFPDLRLQRTASILGGGLPSGVQALSGGAGCLVGEYDQTIAQYATAPTGREWIRRAPTVVGSLIFDIGTTRTGATIPTGNVRGPVQLWAADRARELPRINPDEPGFDMSIRQTDDGTSLAIFTALSVGPAVEFLPTVTDSKTTGQLVRLELPSLEVAMTMGISARGDVVAAATSNHLVILRPGSAGEAAITQSLYPIPSVPSDVAVTDCGSTVALCLRGKILLVDSSTGTSRSVDLGSTKMVYNSMFTDDGRFLAAPTGDNVLLIQTASGRVRGTLVSSTGGQIVAAGFSPLGGLIASVSREGRLALWDANTGEELASLDMDSGALLAVRFMADGKRIRWWGEKQAGILELEDGFGRLAQNLPDRLPLALPVVVSQAGTSESLTLVRALKPYAGPAAAEAEKALKELAARSEATPNRN